MGKGLAHGGAEVLMPVIAPTWQVIGVIRLIDPLNRVYERFAYTRNLIIWVLVGGLLLGGTAGALFGIRYLSPFTARHTGYSRMAEGQPLPVFRSKDREKSDPCYEHSTRLLRSCIILKKAACVSWQTWFMNWSAFRSITFCDTSA